MHQRPINSGDIKTVNHSTLKMLKLLHTTTNHMSKKSRTLK